MSSTSAPEYRFSSPDQRVTLCSQRVLFGVERERVSQRVRTFVIRSARRIERRCSHAAVLATSSVNDLLRCVDLSAIRSRSTRQFADINARRAVLLSLRADRDFAHLTARSPARCVQFQSAGWSFNASVCRSARYCLLPARFFLAFRLSLHRNQTVVLVVQNLVPNKFGDNQPCDL